MSPATPNLIDESLWRHAPIHQGGPVVIGFAGTTTHGDDLAMIEEAFRLIALKHGRDVAFHFMGCVTERLSALPGVTHARFTPDYESNSLALQSTRMDLAVVPLVNDRFNSCKSNIKWLEFSACGIAGIYSDLTPYNSCIRSGQTGLFAGNSNEDWFNVIDLLVTNPSLRRDIARQARQEVLSNYSLASSKLGLYEETYGRILAQHRKLLLRGDAATGINLQICGVDLDVAASHEPNLSNVVQRVNRALSRQGTNGGSYSGKGAGAPARGGKDPVRTGTAAIGDGVVSTEVTGLCPNAGWQSIRSEDGGLRIALEGRLQEKNVMIRLTRLNQTEVILNSDLIEHIEMGADSGHTYQRQLLCGPGEC